MTRSTSPVAVCCSKASVSSRLEVSDFFCNSLNSRMFSTAITAWSAKVSSRISFVPDLRGALRCDVVPTIL